MATNSKEITENRHNNPPPNLGKHRILDNPNSLLHTDDKAAFLALGFAELRWQPSLSVFGGMSEFKPDDDDDDGREGEGEGESGSKF